jgi:hypothetical protein
MGEICGATFRMSMIPCPTCPKGTHVCHETPGHRGPDRCSCGLAGDGWERPKEGARAPGWCGEE